MGTDIRPEISKRNKYWISKHRYYELKHFCLQYNEWKEMYSLLTGISKSEESIPNKLRLQWSDPTMNIAAMRERYFSKMKLIEDVAQLADPTISKYILKAVTEGVTYVYLSTVSNIPCGRDMFYDRYRKFFWLLDSQKLHIL